MIEFLKFKTIQSKINQLLFIIEAPHLTSFHCYSPSKPPLETTNLIWNWYSKSTSSAQLAGYQTFGGPACCKLTTMAQVHHVTTHSRCATGGLWNFPLDTHQQKQLLSHAFPAPKGRQNHLPTIGIFNAKMLDSGRVFFLIGHQTFAVEAQNKHIFPFFFAIPFSQL